MPDTAALGHLQGAPMRRWWWLAEWAFAESQRPLPFARALALDIAMQGLKLEYHGYRAKMSLSMLITRSDTRSRFYTLSTFLRRGRKGRRR